MIVLIATIIAVVLFTGMSVFQLLLVLGLPFAQFQKANGKSLS